MNEQHPTQATTGAPAYHTTSPVPGEAGLNIRTTGAQLLSPPVRSPARTQPARKLQCSQCDDYPGGFRSEHELRRHTNRVHKTKRTVWITYDSSPDKTFLANCRACQNGRTYNESYNAASHLRRMHFHPHKRGERKMSAAEARKGGKTADLDPPMHILKEKWLREIEVIEGKKTDEPPEPPEPSETSDSRVLPPLQPPGQIPTRQSLPPVAVVTEGRTSQTPTTPSTRSMAIKSIMD